PGPHWNEPVRVTNSCLTAPPQRASGSAGCVASAYPIRMSRQTCRLQLLEPPQQRSGERYPVIRVGVVGRHLDFSDLRGQLLTHRSGERDIVGMEEIVRLHDQ